MQSEFVLNKNLFLDFGVAEAKAARKSSFSKSESSEENSEAMVQSLAASQVADEDDGYCGSFNFSV